VWLKHPVDLPGGAQDFVIPPLAGGQSREASRALSPVTGSEYLPQEKDHGKVILQSG
jgi:hypothetical protein